MVRSSVESTETNLMLADRFVLGPFLMVEYFKDDVELFQLIAVHLDVCEGEPSVE